MIDHVVKRVPKDLDQLELVRDGESAREGLLQPSC